MLPRSWSRRRAAAVGACLSTAIALGFPGAPATATPPGRADTRVIVFLRSPGPAGGVPVARAKSTAVERPVRAQIAASGGRVSARFSLLAGMAATVSPTEVDALRARSDVAAVIPDELVRVSRPSAPNNDPASPLPGVVPRLNRTVCPTDPRRPLLEPEALSLMHAASDDPSVPSAADYATGAGVRVGILADSLDVNNPDLRRADGTPVVVDYRDFAGDGTSSPGYASEAMGDAASIAAQGNTVYDLSAFGAVPAGCTVRVVGVAPGADVVALKFFDGSGVYYDSSLVEAIDYAVTVEHVDVLNESLDDDPYPDSGQDPVTLANAAAVAAGVTITTGSGDSGYQAIFGPPGSSLRGADGMIDVGATTQLQLEKQVGYYPSGVVRSGDIANLSSNAIAQTGRTLDAVAPGYYGWSLCTPDPAMYLDCPTYPGAASGLQKFSGTSESAPLTAGVAALVIQRYRETHGGASPTPQLVKQIITSTADDIGAPAEEQGAGEVNALRAVLLAGARDHGTAAASSPPAVLVTPTQRAVTVAQGHTGHVSIAVGDPTPGPLTVAVALRHDQLTGTQRLATTIGAAGFSDTYFTVAPGTDRFAATLTWADGSAIDLVDMALFDPSGNIDNEASGQGSTTNLRSEVDRPQPGRWDLNVANYGGAGPATLIVESFRHRSTAEHTIRLAAHTQRTIPVPVPAVDGAGDSTDAVTVTDAASARVLTTVPIVVRTPIALSRGHGAFRGHLDGGNGRPAFLAGAATYAVDVPDHTQTMRVRLMLDTTGSRVDAYLVSPGGEALDQQSTLAPTSGQPSANEIDLSAVGPQAGRWRVVLGLNGPLNGTAPRIDYTGRIDLGAPPVSETGLPQSVSSTLPANQPHHATVRLVNDTGAAHAYVLDARLDTTVNLALAGPATETIDASDPFPIASVLVPPETSRIDALLTATQPLAADLAPTNFSYPGSNNDPEIFQASTTGRLHLSATATQLVDGPWLELPTAVGPFASTGIPAAFTVHLHPTVDTKQFDHGLTSTTGDPWLSSVGPAPAANLVVVPPHGHVSLAVTIRPAGGAGHQVRGTLYVDTWDPVNQVSGELAQLPYAYTVAG